jgi:RNA polymerase sigma-70 factor (ECF subfamily)
MGDSISDKRRLFEQEVLPHLDVLFTAALYLTRNQEEANDLCQETMLRAYRFFHQYTAGTNCRAWLLTILHNLFRTERSRAKPEHVSATAEEFDRVVENESLRNGSGAITPEKILADRSVDQSVQKALRSLPEDFKAAVILVDVEDMTYQEAAAVLEVPIGTVRSRISRGRGLMRQALEKLAGGRGFARAET